MKVSKSSYMNNNKKGKMLFIHDEDILNLKNARRRIFDTLKYDRQYEALEIFTIDDIISQFEKAPYKK